MNTPVSFELAKLLKEKGFDDQTLHFYTKPRSKMFGIDEHNRYYNIVNTPKKLYTCGEHSVADIKNVYSAPTIAEVVMWLYEKHGIWIFILPQDKSIVDWRVESSKYPSLPLFLLIVKYEKDESMKEVLNSSDPNSDMFLYFDEPTEAYEKAIKYCLKELI